MRAMMFCSYSISTQPLLSREEVVLLLPHPPAPSPFRRGGDNTKIDDIDRLCPSISSIFGG
jgi:hypothetical protein